MTDTNDPKYKYFLNKLRKITAPEIFFIEHLLYRSSWQLIYELLFFSSTKRVPIMDTLYVAWRRPTLTGGNPQLPSALRSLTSVFGMGTGVTFSLSSPNYLI